MYRRLQVPHAHIIPELRSRYQYLRLRPLLLSFRHSFLCLFLFYRCLDLSLPLLPAIPALGPIDNDRLCHTLFSFCQLFCAVFFAFFVPFTERREGCFEEATVGGMEFGEIGGGDLG